MQPRHKLDVTLAQVRQQLLGLVSTRDQKTGCLNNERDRRHTQLVSRSNYEQSVRFVAEQLKVIVHNLIM